MLHGLSVCIWSIAILLPKLELTKANASDTEATFMDLHLSFSNGYVSSKIYNKRDDFDFDIVFFFSFLG